MTDLSALIERLEKAEKPSRGIDAEISAALEPHLFDAPGVTPIRPIPGFRYDPTENIIRFEGGGLMDVRFFPPVTVSIDAAVSLTERVLPGWCFDEIGQDWEGSPAGVTGFGWTVEMINGLTRVQGQAKAFPMAILLATLRALQSKGEV